MQGWAVMRTRMMLDRRCADRRWASKISYLPHSVLHFVGVGRVSVFSISTYNAIF